LTGALDKYARVNGLRLHYLEWGGRNRETVLLLHGFGNCAATWYRLAGLLAAARRVIALDLRGHGDSEWSDTSAYTLDDHAADVAGLLAQLKIERVSLVGHSMGSAVAQRYAAKHPAGVERLVLVDSAPYFTEAALKVARARPAPPPPPASLAAAADHLALSDPTAPREVMLKEAVFLTRRHADGSLVWKCHQTSGLSELSAAEMAARWEILRSIRCPTLLLRGSRSQVLDAPVAAEMVRVMAAARLIEVPDAGHYVHRDNPERFEKAVLEFLGL